ncbi:MAG: CHASE2 domain-containing protein, partial [Cyanobacteria bacterium J06650_10]
MVDQLQKSSTAKWLHMLRDWRQQLANQRSMALILGVVATSGILLLRNVGAFQSWELQAFDWMMNHRLAEKPDDRIVIIGITEQDIDRAQNAIVSDTLIANVIEGV